MAKFALILGVVMVVLAIFIAGITLLFHIFGPFLSGIFMLVAVIVTTYIYNQDGEGNADD